MTDAPEADPTVADLIPVAVPKRSLADLLDSLESEELEDVLDGAELNARLPRRGTRRGR